MFCLARDFRCRRSAVRFRCLGISRIRFAVPQIIEPCLQALRTGIGPVSPRRQRGSDTSRFTKHQIFPAASRTRNRRFREEIVFVACVRHGTGRWGGNTRVTLPSKADSQNRYLVHLSLHHTTVRRYQIRTEVTSTGFPDRVFSRNNTYRRLLRASTSNRTTFSRASAARYHQIELSMHFTVTLGGLRIPQETV